MQPFDQTLRPLPQLYNATYHDKLHPTLRLQIWPTNGYRLHCMRQNKAGACVVTMRRLAGQALPRVPTR
jgi:hypothetical protein